MKNQSKKLNTLGIIALSIAILYLVVTLCNSVMNVKSMTDVWDYFGFWGTVERIHPNKALGFLVVMLRIIAPFLVVLAGAFFAAAAVKRKEVFRVPVALSLAYSAILFFQNLLAYFNDPSFTGFILPVAADVIALAAWVVLITGTSRSHRISFAVLRFLTLGYGIVAVIRQIIGGFSFSIWYNVANFAYYVIHTITLTMLILWIAHPALFYKSEDKESVDKEMILS